MTTVGLIGSGNIGATVARLAVAAGYDVVLSNSRGPAALAPLVEELTPHARAATPAEAARAGDIVVVAIPFGVISSVPVEPTAGKVVIDANNYYPERDGYLTALDNDSITSSELLAQHLPEAHVVKAFNNIFYRHLLGLARPSGASDRTTLAIAGDDDAAKKAVAGFLDDIGYDALDVGALAEGWRYQRDTEAYGIYLGQGSDPWAVGRSVTADELRAALARARRYAEMTPRD